MAHVEVITSTKLGSDTASITFGSIPQTYKHLMIHGVVRTDRASDFDNLAVSFSYETDYADYTSIMMYWSTSMNSNSSGRTTGYANWRQAIYCTGDNGDAQMFGGYSMWVPNYTDTDVNKTMIGQSVPCKQAQLVYYPSVFEGDLRNTAAVTEIKFEPAYGTNLMAGTHLVLYGLK